jgi:hypothetical protein
MKSIIAKKKAEEEAKANEKVEDPLAVKLTNVPGGATEKEIRAAMEKFGKIE